MDLGPFRKDFGDCARDLREALRDGVTAAGLNGRTPQEVSRGLGLDKMLAWKISQVVAQDDPYLWARHVPGRAGMAKVGDAFRRHRVPAPIVARLEASVSAFESMVSRHVGDRSSLHAVVSGMVPDQQARLLHEARRLAFRGNSGTLGVQARAQFTTYLLTRNADDPDLADMVQIGGMVGLRRLRPDVRWPLFHRNRWSSEGLLLPSRQPLDPRVPGGDDFPWMRDFSTQPLPSVGIEASKDGISYTLTPGPIGLTGAVSCTYGIVERRVGPVRRTGPEQTGELGISLLTPVSRMQLDIFLDDTLGWETLQEYELLSLVHGSPKIAIPSAEKIEDLGPGLVGVSSPHIPDYAELVRTAFALTGWPIERFHGWRLAMDVPPIPATALLRCRLAD